MTPEPRALSRRTFVRTGLLGAAGIWVASDALLGRSVAAIPGATDVRFAQGVACGQVEPRAATLWTALDGLQTSSRLTVEVARDPGFANVVARTEALADPAAAGTARVRIGGLAPREQYWYRFASADGSSDVGMFKTAPPADSRERLRLAFFSCQDFIVGNYAALRDMAEQEPDVVVCLGDYIYEKAFFDGQVRQVPETPDGAARTLPEYRALYATYHSDEFLRAVRATAPLVSIWDDHEVEDNYAADLPGGASKDGRPVPFLERRAAGYQAWHEAMPLIPDGQDRDRSQSRTRYGQVDLFGLDTRRFRTDQPCNPDDSFITVCTDLGATQRKDATMLGSAQRSALLSDLRSSSAPWKLIANQVMAMSLDLIPGFPVNTDSWDGYAYERSLICDEIEHRGIKDVVFVTGDIHTFFAGSVTRTGRARGTWAPGLRRGPEVATEVVIGSVTSQGISDRFGDSEGVRNAFASVLDPVLKAANAHYSFVNSAYKGYGLLDVSTDGIDVQLRAVREPRDPASGVFTLQHLRIERGAPGAKLAARAAALPVDAATRPSVQTAKAAVRSFVA